MNKTPQELIGEIRGLSRCRIESRRQEAIVDEVQAHLDAAIQGRIELGLERHQAEQEAVASFGDPLEFVNKMVAQHPLDKHLWFDKSTAKALLATMGFFAFFFIFVAQLDQYWHLMIAVYIVAILGFGGWIAKASACAKKPQFLPLITALCFGTPLVATLMSFQYIADPSELRSQGITRTEAEKELAQANNHLRDAMLTARNFQADADRFYFSAQGDPPMKIVWRPSSDERPDKYQIVPAASREEANKTWRKVLPKAYVSFANGEQGPSMWISQLQRELDQPFLTNVFLHVPGGLDLSGQLVEMMGLISLASWSVTQIRISLRKKGRLITV